MVHASRPSPAGPWVVAAGRSGGGDGSLGSPVASWEPGPLVRPMPRGAARCVPGGGASGAFRLVQSRRRGRERNRPLAALTPHGQDLFPDAGTPPGFAGTPHLLTAEKHLGRPGPAGCPPALLRLRAFRRRNTPQPRPRRRGPARKQAHHEPHQLRRDHHLRQARLRQRHNPGGLGLRGRLRPDMPWVRRGPVRALPAVVERRRAPLLGRGSASLGACGHPVSARVEHVSRATCSRTQNDASCLSICMMQIRLHDGVPHRFSVPEALGGAEAWTVRAS